MSGEGARAFALGPGEGARLEGPLGGPITLKARTPETGGAMMAGELTIPPGDGPPLHVHGNEDEAIYVLEGKLVFRLGDDLHDSPAGTFVFIPRGKPHTFRNAGGEPARLFIIFAPAGMERFFERMAEEGLRADDRAAFAAMALEVGMEVVGPPLAAE